MGFHAVAGCRRVCCCRLIDRRSARSSPAAFSCSGIPRCHPPPRCASHRRQLLEALALQAAPIPDRGSDLTLEYEAAAPGVPSDVLAAAAKAAAAAAVQQAAAAAAASTPAMANAHSPPPVAGAGAAPAAEAAAPAGALPASPSTDSLLQLALLAAQVWGEQTSPAEWVEPEAAAEQQVAAAGRLEAAEEAPTVPGAAAEQEAAEADAPVGAAEQ